MEIKLNELKKMKKDDLIKLIVKKFEKIKSLENKIKNITEKIDLEKVHRIIFYLDNKHFSLIEIEENNKKFVRIESTEELFISPIASNSFKIFF